MGNHTMDSESVKKAIRYKGLTLTQAANQSNQSYINLANKLRRGGIGVSGEKELNRFGEVLDAKYYSFFEFPDGKRFGNYPDHERENTESVLTPIQVDELSFPIYQPKSVWVKASDLFNFQNVQDISLGDWVAFRFRYENENRKVTARPSLQEGKDYIRLENDWLFSLDLAAVIEPILWNLKEKQHETEK